MALSPFSATWKNDVAKLLNGLLTFVGLTVDTDGTMAADSDARIATQKATRTYVASKLSTQPSFAANKNGSNQGSITDDTDIKLTFTTEVYDTGSYYDAANSKWVPPAGVAWVGVRVLVLTPNQVDGQGFFAKVYKNGAQYAAQKMIMNGTTETQQILVFTQMIVNGTDEIEAYVRIDTSGGDGSVSGSVVSTEFLGHMISVG